MTFQRLVLCSAVGLYDGATFAATSSLAVALPIHTFQTHGFFAGLGALLVGFITSKAIDFTIFMFAGQVVGFTNSTLRVRQIPILAPIRLVTVFLGGLTVIVMAIYGVDPSMVIAVVSTILFSFSAFCAHLLPETAQPMSAPKLDSDQAGPSAGSA